MMYPVSRLGNVSRTESSADFTSTAADDITSVMCRDVAIISSVLQSAVDSCEMLTTLSLSNLSTNSSDSSPCTPVSRYAFKPIFFDPHFLFYPSRLRHSSSLRLSLLSLLTSLAPAPLKLRPYGAIQICLLLLLLHFRHTGFHIGLSSRSMCRPKFMITYDNLVVICDHIIQLYFDYGCTE